MTSAVRLFRVLSNSAFGAVSSASLRFSGVTLRSSSVIAAVRLPVAAVSHSFHSSAPRSVSPRDVSEALEADNVRKLIDDLKSTGRRQVPLEEFMRKCEAHGIKDDNAKKETLKNLHKTGSILHFPETQEEHLRSTVLLRPEEVIEDFLTVLDVSGERARSMLENAFRSLEEINSEISRMQTTKDVLDTRARRHANLTLSGGFIFVVSQWLLLARLTWWEFSWDIMEPITFFLTSATGIVGYTFFLFTKQNFEYGNIHDVITNRRKRKLYQRTGFDIQHYEDLLSDKQTLEGEIRKLQKRIGQLSSNGKGVSIEDQGEAQ